VALTIRFRAKIAAGLYNLVYRFPLASVSLRARKRFLDNAIKAADKRLG
jgi:hypothetical protein